MRDINYYKQYEPIDGKWYITEELGKGAFGTVFEIERRDFSQAKSALKVITIPASPNEVRNYCDENFDSDEKSVTSYFYGFVEEFINEFKLMTKLRGNSNIVSIEDYDVKKHEDGIGWDIFIRMELLTPMNKYFKENKLNQRAVIKLGIDICKALEICQKYKIIHRDIKPSNIFVSDTGEFKLGDFGIARTLEKTSSGLSKKGTYTYMAPEVFKGEEYGSNVDIYSLGIVMYRLLNNNYEPFRKERTHNDEENALMSRLKGEIMPKPANADGRLAEIVLKACNFNPKERYESPLRMRQELESILYSDNDVCVIYPDGDKIEYNPTNNTLSSDETAGLFGDTAIDKTEGFFKTQIDEGKTEGFFGTAMQDDKTEGIFDVPSVEFHIGNDEIDENAHQNKRSLSSKGIMGIIAGFVAVIGIFIAIFIGNLTKNFSDTLPLSMIAADVRIVDTSYLEVLSSDDFSNINLGYNDKLKGYIDFEIKDESISKFENAQSNNLENPMQIYINGELIAEPVLNEIISSNSFVISGLTEEQIKRLSDLLDIAGDISYVTQKGTLVVGITEYEPISYRDENGTWIGIDCELATILSKMLGVQVEFYEMSWDEKDALLNDKTIDCIWNGMSLTPERQEALACSDIYLFDGEIEGYSVGFRKDSDLVYLCNDLIQRIKNDGTLQDIIDRYGYLYVYKLNVGISPDFEPMEYIDANGNITGFDVDYIEEVMRRIGIEYELLDMPFDTLLQKLNAGDIDVVISSITITEDRLKMCDFTNTYVTHIYENGDAVEDYSMGILKNWSGLLNRMNSEIEIMADDGTTEKLRQKYNLK